MKSLLTVSGKGGTGKSIISINLAKALKAKGIRVSLIDLDIDSSNIAAFLNLKGDFNITRKSGVRRFIPVQYEGIEVFSMSFISKDKPVSMTGSNYAKIVSDVLLGTDWTGEYFVCDLPSGTGDIFKEATRVLADSLLGSLVVMQPAHILDARRVLELHKKEGIPVIGLIENMSRFVCPKCETPYNIFGEGVGSKTAKEFKVDFFGSIPLSEKLRGNIENGQPILPKKMLKPIDKAVKKILKTPKLKPSVIKRLKEGAKKIITKNLLLDLLAFSVRSLHSIDLRGVMGPYGFAGGRTFELNITNKDLKEVRIHNCFRIDNGILRLIRQPKSIDARLFIWDQALIWCSLGYMKDGNGERIPYSWKDAWQLNKVDFDGVGTADALEFIDNMWREIPPLLASKTKLLKIYERFA